MYGRRAYDSWSAGLRLFGRVGAQREMSNAIGKEEAGMTASVNNATRANAGRSDREPKTHRLKRMLVRVDKCS